MSDTVKRVRYDKKADREAEMNEVEEEG